MAQSDEATESRWHDVTEKTLLCRPAAALLARLLVAWAALGPQSASPLEARTCLGFSGHGFLGASGAVRREWSENMTGIGASGGLRVRGQVAATGHYLKFSGADRYDQQFDFETARVTLAYELPTSSLSLCPTLSTGLEGISSRDFSSFPYKSKPFLGGGLAVGYPFTADSGVTIIPSLSASIESHVVERIIEGDISIDERETTVLLGGGLTVEFGRLFVRPYATLIAVENGWLTGGTTVGVRF